MPASTHRQPPATARPRSAGDAAAGLRQVIASGVEFLAAWRQPLAASCPLHSHAGIELVVHRTGGGRTAIADGRAQEFLPGSAILYGPGVAHGQRATPPGEELCVQMIPRHAVAGLPDLLHVPACDAYVQQEAGLLAAVPADERRSRATELGLRATALLLRVLDQGRRTTRRAAPPIDGHALAARDMLAGIACDPDCLRRVVAASAIGADHLRHCFRRAYGVGMARYMTRLRVDHAKDLLAHTRLPLREIARQCGYSNERYFCRVFRAVLGSTPGAYRARSGA